jgi:hypothetical protein
LRRRTLDGRPSGKMRLVGLPSKKECHSRGEEGCGRAHCRGEYDHEMNPNGMDEFTREWWELTRMEILHCWRQALGCGGRALATGGATSAPGDGGVPPDDELCLPVMVVLL